MFIERYIYTLKDLETDYANIQIHISPPLVPCDTYTLFIKAIALNDEIFDLKIENVTRINLEDACVLVLNTFHMYWMPMYVCKDIIDDEIDERDFSSDLFNIMIDKLTEPNEYAHPEIKCEWLKGKIIVQDDGTLSFEWERPLLHSHDNGDGQEIILFDLYLQTSIQYHSSEHTQKAPEGFKYPCL